MKVAIYNRYLNTCGGGEQHMAAIAEFLSLKKGWNVEILTYDSVDLERISKKIHRDLSQCSVRYITNMSNEEVEDISEEYDLFLNCSYLSMLQPRAKKNIFLMFFPPVLSRKWITHTSLFQWCIQKMQGISKFNINTEEGFYHIEGRHDSEGLWRSGVWTKKQFSIIVPKLMRNTTVVRIETIPHQKNPLEIESVTSNGEPCQYHIQDNQLYLHIPLTQKQNKVTVTLQNSFQPSNADTRKLGVFIHKIKYKKGSLIANTIRALSHRIYEKSRQYASYGFLNAYDLILANSEYTQKWIKKLWGKDSVILYPSVNIEAFFNDTKKHKMILSVGRFFEGSHNKKHLPMINAFKKLSQDPTMKGWSYHLCGGTHKEKIHQDYVKKLKNAAKGAPIYIHTDIPFEELTQFYSHASIFWHASGYGENENLHPDKFEHFGITTVEAMAAGCIPVVIAKAGQLEIVEDGENGFLWNTLDELTKKTKDVVNMPEDMIQRLQTTAIQSTQRYNQNRFEDHLNTYLNLL